MADMGAIDRAAGSGALPPNPVEGPAPEADAMDIIREEMQGTQALIQAQMQQGNPGAEPAMMAFQQLIEAMKGMTGEPAAQAPVEEEAQVPLESGQTVI